MSHELKRHAAFHFSHLHNEKCSICCLSEDNTDICLYAYLLLCANELHFTVHAHAYICKYGAL